MTIDKVYSNRKSNNGVYSDLIYEWEDDFAKGLDIPIISYSRFKNKLLNGMRKLLDKALILPLVQNIDKRLKRKNFTLIFELYPLDKFSYRVSSNKIPYIIDFDFRVDLKAFYRTYKNCQLIIISSLQAYQYLVENKCPLNIKHLQLSLSDQFQLNRSTISKEFDVIIARSNRVLLDYVKKYAIDHPDFEYVVRKWAGNTLYKGNVYYSNKKGEIGEFSERSSYFALLKKTKVALYATPGYDEPERRFLNHVTPSLFEYISSGCKIIARYPNNAETISFGLGTIAPSTESYDDFCKTLAFFLSSNDHSYLKESEKFLQKNYTSKRISQFKSIILNQSL